MKSMRIPLITLALTLGAASAAWGAESVMNLISSGEAVQKEVADAKAKTEAAEKKNKDLVEEGKELNATNAKLNADIAALNKDSDSITQRKADFANQCPSGKTFTPDQLAACKSAAAQINADIVANTAKNAELKKRNEEFAAKAKAYNDTIKSDPNAAVKSAYDAFNAATKKEGAWLDAAREQMSSEGFKAYGAKAGCPDVNKPAKTTDAMMKMADDVIACLKKVSNS
jgi:cell division protein FtsB